MKAIEKYLSKADEVLKDPASKLVKIHTANNSYQIADGTYDGYLNGFGPAVITAGLLPTLATYQAKEDKEKVLNAIAKVVSIANCNNGKQLLEHCLNAQKAELNLLKEKIINASVALKLMIRTYQQQND